MGWLNEDGTACEGYVVAMVPAELPLERVGPCSVIPRYLSHETWPLRELGHGDAGEVINISLVRVACACGWRSAVLYSRAEYVPSYTWIPAEHEDRAVTLWREQHLMHRGQPRALIERRP